VEFLVEVCDPCEVPGLGYTVNGVRVSDFYTPQYFDPSEFTESPGVRYDFRGHIKAPRQVLRGGYLSWREPDGIWYQEKFFGMAPVFTPPLGRFDKNFGSLRAWIDSASIADRTKVLRQRQDSSKQVLVRLSGEYADDNDLGTQATKRRAGRLREQISAVRKRGQ
jgi:hypothetical protein